MVTRRQERMARVIKEVVSDAVTNHLNDPRIESFVSVTRVEVAADMRIADVFFSMFGTDETKQKRTFEAILHAKSRIQVMLGDAMQSKFCPVLRFHLDEQFKKMIETINIIDKAAAEIKKSHQVDEDNKQDS
jgi:ribosome-binding factor A